MSECRPDPKPNHQVPGCPPGSCNTYPAYPGCIPTTEIPSTHPPTALTGAELHDPIAAFLLLGAIGFVALLGSLRYFARERFVRR